MASASVRMGLTYKGLERVAHPDADPDPEIRNKSSNSIPDLSIPDQRMQNRKI